MLDRLRSVFSRRKAEDAGAAQRALQREVGKALRQYANARVSRLNSDWRTITSSADSELWTSLRVLRDRSRSLVRDSNYAKRAKAIVVNNVIGTGIGLQAQVKTTRGGLNQSINDSIEAAFREWSRARYCHTGGVLHLSDLERAAVGQIFEAGEVFFRKHYRSFGGSRIPFALELIESERIAEEYQSVSPPPDGGTVRLGIEVDRYDRPIAYWIRERHPGELRSVPGSSTRIERVPADQIIHLYVCDRWPQARGVPWLHTAIERLRDSDGYCEAEIVAARAAACYMGFIKSPEDPVGTTEDAHGNVVRELQAGLIEELGPGEDFIPHSPNRPNTAMEAFMRALLREIAAGVGVSYESLSRDYSQSNYSSSRLALLDDRELWRVLQGWFIRTFREELHREWLQQAVYARAIQGVSVESYVAAQSKFEQVRFKPRGWGWIDPTKEVEAYEKAVRCGFTTVADVIAATAGGQDIEDVLEGRRLELDMMAAKDLTFDTHTDAAPKPAPVPAPEAPAKEPEEEDEPARVLRLRGRA